MKDYSHLATDGACEVEECEMMYGIVRAIKPTYCVETGTYRGLSASYIGQALKDNNQGFLDTCDPFDRFEAKESLAHLAPLVTCNTIRGDRFIPRQKIDFLFIDGLHEKEEVMKEFRHFEPELNDGAIVMFHDCGPGNAACDVNGAVEALGLQTTFLPTHNKMRIYAYRPQEPDRYHAQYTPRWTEDDLWDTSETDGPELPMASTT